MRNLPAKRNRRLPHSASPQLRWAFGSCFAGKPCCRCSASTLQTVVRFYLLFICYFRYYAFFYLCRRLSEEAGSLILRQGKEQEFSPFVHQDPPEEGSSERGARRGTLRDSQGVQGAGRNGGSSYGEGDQRASGHQGVKVRGH